MAQTEKPYHYTYLKEFRVNQCPVFLQHKCTQHRPFTCFNWHFANQRRRRPLKKRDGTFNYSADVYCSNYDETTGICPLGDDCPYIHRNTGDTERRYHLRYYKTGTCIHETDSRGNCVKNGPHCAFAHGAHDLRPPVYDIRERDNQNDNSSGDITNLGEVESVNLSEKIVSDDSRWHDAHYVLANYKTEQCRRPPRLCRQGYACPQFHNPKDRRRNPKKCKYKSSPCPSVKQGDDWKDPTCCERGDSCQFCHTRTEQQFHPEIYKSTKCHDMMQTGYCPRGPFCAFAHIQQEIRVIEDEQFHGDQTLMNVEMVTEQDLMRTVEKPAPTRDDSSNEFQQDLTMMHSHANAMNIPNYQQQQFKVNSNSYEDQMVSNSFPSCPSPISKPQPNKSDFQNIPYTRAPGSGRNDGAHNFAGLPSSYGHSHSPFAWGSLPVSQTLGSFSSNGSSPSFQSRLFNSLNSEATPFYPPDETVDSVVENALLEDFMDHCDIGYHEKQGLSGSMPRNMGWPGLIGSGRDNSLMPKISSPMNIPQESLLGNNHTPSPPLRSTSNQLEYSHHLQSGSLPFVGNTKILSGQMPHRHKERSLSGSILSGSYSGNNNSSEVEKMRNKCKQWEDCWNQAKNACSAWKKEATQANQRAKRLEELNQKDKEKITLQDEGLRKHHNEIDKLKSELNKATDTDNICKFVHSTQTTEELKLFSVDDLKVLRKRVKNDLELIDQILWVNHSVHGDEGWVSTK